MRHGRGGGGNERDRRRTQTEEDEKEEKRTKETEEEKRKAEEEEQKTIWEGEEMKENWNLKSEPDTQTEAQTGSKRINFSLSGQDTGKHPTIALSLSSSPPIPVPYLSLLVSHYHGDKRETEDREK